MDGVTIGICSPDLPAEVESKQLKLPGPPGWNFSEFDPCGDLGGADDM